MDRGLLLTLHCVHKFVIRDSETLEKGNVGKCNFITGVVICKYKH